MDGQPDHFLAYRFRWPFTEMMIPARVLRVLARTVMGPHNYPKTVSSAGIQWYDPSFLSAAPAFTFGNCPASGPVIGPGYADVDLACRKTSDRER